MLLFDCEDVAFRGINPCGYIYKTLNTNNLKDKSSFLNFFFKSALWNQKNPLIFAAAFERNFREQNKRVKRDFTKFIDILTDSVASDFGLIL